MGQRSDEKVVSGGYEGNESPHEVSHFLLNRNGKDHFELIKWRKYSI